MLASTKTHAKLFYGKNSKITAEYHCICSAMAPLTELCGDNPAASFSAASLRLVRDPMIYNRGSRREYFNKSVSRIIRAFRHAFEVDEEIASLIHKLEKVKPLEAGRSNAIDYEPRSAAPVEALEKIKTVTDAMTTDMIDVALLSGARGGEMLTNGAIEKAEEDGRVLHAGKCLANRRKCTGHWPIDATWPRLRQRSEQQERRCSLPP